MGNPHRNEAGGMDDRDFPKIQSQLHPSTPKIKLRPSGPSKKESSKCRAPSKIKEGLEKKAPKRDIPISKDKEGLIKKGKPINRAEARLQKLVKTLRTETDANLEARIKTSKEKAAEVIDKYCSIENLKVKPGSSDSSPNAQCRFTKKSPSQGKVSFKVKSLSPNKIKNPFEQKSKPGESGSQNKTTWSDPLVNAHGKKDSPHHRNYVANTFKRKSTPEVSLHNKFKDDLDYDSEEYFSPKNVCTDKYKKPAIESTVHSQRLKKVTAAHLSTLSEKGLLNEAKRSKNNPASTSKMTNVDNKTAPLCSTSRRINYGQYRESKTSEVASSFYENDDMEMDWESIPDELVISDIHSIRADTTLIDETVPMDVDMDQEGLHHIEKELTTSVVHLVIDTNVLISHLVIVKDLVTSKIKGMRVKLVIPWQVLRELDHLKNRDANKVAQKARMASNYLLAISSSNEKTIYFQSRREELLEVENFLVEIPDDQILKCCLQLQSRSHNVVLLTNDQNLRLKCTACKIVAASCQEVMSVYKGESSVSAEKYPVEAEPPSNNQLLSLIQDFSCKVNRFLTDVLIQILKDLYRDMWAWFAPSKPPWRLKQTIKYAIKLLPQFEEDLAVHSNINNLKELDKFFSNPNPSDLTKESFQASLENCKSFCKTMPAMPVYEQILQPFLFELKELITVASSSNEKSEDQQVAIAVSVFQLFEAKITQYCEKCLSDKTEERINLQELTKNIENVSKIVKFLKVIQLIPCGKVTVYSHGIAELHATLLSSIVDEVDCMFTIETVVSFCNNQGIRTCLSQGIQCFEKFLKTMKPFLDQKANKGR